MKRLILVRHAHRDTGDGRNLDNGLSEKGKKQAELVKDYYITCFGDESMPLFSSPKKRCVETLQPLAKHLKQKIEVVQSVGEGNDLFQRTEDFLLEWLARDIPVCIASSHGDWIPIFIERYAGFSTEIKKGGWAELEHLDGKKFRIVNLIQDLGEV